MHTLAEVSAVVNTEPYRTYRIRAEVPEWVPSEVQGAVNDFLGDNGFVAAECPDVVPCLREIAAELRKPSPSWKTIRDGIHAAQQTSPRRYRLNFHRLEARLSQLFSHRKREWAESAAAGRAA